ncbi:MAG: alpha-amylase family protein [Verrucomicrobiota bacterium]
MATRQADSPKTQIPFSQRRRRLLLDFHNPAGIPDIGTEFEPRSFADTLAATGFDSVIVHAQDSHGYCYYPTIAGTRHPSLQRDLLGEMVTACHTRNIAIGAYVSAGCSDMADPAWLQINAKGKPRSFAEQGGYSMVCLNSPFAEQNVLPITRELLERYPVDVIWYDLLFFFDEGCHCAYCLERMRRHGLDPKNPQDIRRHMRDSIGEFVMKTRRLADQLRPEIEMAYNGLSVHERPAGLDMAAYVDIEALATGGWGYFYFPSKARYLRTLGKPVTGMTAAFHNSWGDFGSLKSRALLEYECYTFLAAGSAVAIGDQLPPRGRLEAARYARIGEVLNPIVALAPWLAGAKPLAEAAIVLYPLAQGQFPDSAWAGANKLLMEGRVQFDTVDIEADWSNYRLLIFPDHAHVTDAVKAKVAGYLAAGGAVMASGDAWAVLPEGVIAQQQETSGPAYLQVHGAWAGAVPDMPHVVKKGIRRISAPGAQVLATVVESYPRVGDKCFYSSPQMPYTQATDRPAIIRQGSVVYLAAPLFREYWESGYGVHRQILAGAVSLLLPAPLTKSNMPLAWEQAVLAQGDHRLVNVIVPFTSVRHETVAQIEEWPATVGITVGVRGHFTGACLAPSEEPLSCIRDGPYTIAELPPVEGPCVVIFE